MTRWDATVGLSRHELRNLVGVSVRIPSSVAIGSCISSWAKSAVGTSGARFPCGAGCAKTRMQEPSRLVEGQGGGRPDRAVMGVLEP
jgi:hypothetical protein